MALAGTLSQQAGAFGAAADASAQPSLSQCVALRTSGADRLLTARWFFAVLSKSPQIVDLSATTKIDTAQLDKGFAALLTRIVTKDCIAEIRPLAAIDVKAAFGAVGAALGEIAMQEMLSGKEVDQAVEAYTKYLSQEDFKPLMDSLPKSAKK